MAVSVLIAQADESSAEGCKRLLSLCNFQVETVSNGIDCLRSLRQVPPDLLLLDPELPWGGGEGVMAIMREGDDIAAVPVILLCGRSENPVSELMMFPVVECLEEPFSIATLIKTIRAVLAAGRAQLVGRPCPLASP